MPGHTGSSIRAVLFDLGDTLWQDPTGDAEREISALTNHRVQGLLDARGYRPSDQPLGALIRSALLDAYRSAGRGNGRSPDLAAVCAATAKAAGLETSSTFTDALLDAVNVEGCDIGRRLFPDALGVLGTLRRRGFALGIVTNRLFGGVRLLRSLDDLGLSPFFQTVAASPDVGYLKPHRRIFEAAFAGLGADPSHVAMVGDSLAADVAGAHRLGCTTVWRRRGGPATQTIRPDWTIDSLTEILELPPFKTPK